MSKAKQFLDSINLSRPTFYDDLCDALYSLVIAGDVEEDQDWDFGTSTWTFDDGSAVVMHEFFIIAKSSTTTTGPQ